MGHWFHPQKVVREYEQKISDLKNTPQTQLLGTCALLLNPHGQVLLGKRKNSYKAGYYGLPGGRIELHEPIATAIAREVEEETGIKLSTLTYIGVVRENQDNYDFIHFVFAAENITQEPQLCEPEKCEGWQWVDFGVINDTVLPGHVAAVQLFKQKSGLVDLNK